jgi:hypothetical protein
MRILADPALDEPIAKLIRQREKWLGSALMGFVVTQGYILLVVLMGAHLLPNINVIAWVPLLTVGNIGVQIIHIRRAFKAFDKAHSEGHVRWVSHDEYDNYQERAKRRSHELKKQLWADYNR